MLTFGRLSHGASFLAAEMRALIGAAGVIISIIVCNKFHFIIRFIVCKINIILKSFHVKYAFLLFVFYELEFLGSIIESR